MQIKPDVLAVLSTLDFPTDTTVRITEQLDRGMYTKVNKVLEAIGGSWNRREKAHVFPANARARVDLLIDTGEVETSQDVGFFPTPKPLADKLVKLAGVVPGIVVLEPSAGTGRIVDALLACKAHVVACERDKAMRAALHARESDHPSARLWGGPSLVTWDGDDFMVFAKESSRRFDAVVMNPPFCRVGIGDHIDHVRAAFGMLNPGGTLVSVLPASVRFRRDRRYRELREWFEADGTIEDLPDNTFKASGTSVRTVVVRIKKVA